MIEVEANLGARQHGEIWTLFRLVHLDTATLRYESAVVQSAKATDKESILIL